MLSFDVSMNDEFFFVEVDVIREELTGGNFKVDIVSFRVVAEAKYVDFPVVVRADVDISAGFFNVVATELNGVDKFVDDVDVNNSLVDIVSVSEIVVVDTLFVL